MPVFVSELEEQDEATAWNLPNALLTLQTLILIVVTVVILVFPDFVISVFSEWTAKGNPNKYALMRESIRWLAPCLIFLSLGSTTYIILNSYKKFFLAAFGDASWKICLVVALVVGHFLDLGYRALFFGLLIGSAAKLLTHLVGMLGNLKRLRVSFDWRSKAFQAMLLLMLPLIAGIIFAKFRDVFNVRILTHIDQRGVVQSADLGKKLFSTVSWLVPFTLQIALFPFLCDLVEKDDKEQLGKVLTKSCRLLVAVFVPGAMILAALSERFSIFFFLGGKTGLQVAAWTGVATACYVLVLPAAAVECVLMQGYFAKRKMISVSVIGIICSSLSVIISYIFVVWLQVGPLHALLVVALGFVFSRMVKSVILSVVLGKSVPLFPLASTMGYLTRLTIIGVLAGAATWGTMFGANRILNDGLTKAKSQIWKYEHSKLKADAIEYQATPGTYKLSGNVQLTTDLLDLKTEEMLITLEEAEARISWQDEDGSSREEVVLDTAALGSSLCRMLAGIPGMLRDCSQSDSSDAKPIDADNTKVFPNGQRMEFFGNAKATRKVLSLKAEALTMDLDAEAKLVSFTAKGKPGQSVTLRNEPMPAIRKIYTFIHLALGGVVGGLIFLLAAWILRVKEPFDMLRWVLAKVMKKLASGKGSDGGQDGAADSAESE